MDLDRIVVQEKECPPVMDWRLVEMWADGIPLFPENDPSNPEWKATPVREIDLTSSGYGVVHVKDESCNPTGTIKDRPAWEIAALYRDFARGLFLQDKGNHINGNINGISVPRFTYLTAGNMGRSISEALKKHGLPPMKLLVHLGIDAARLDTLKSLHADVYMTDLHKRALSAQEILALTNNAGGIELTSVTSIEPQAVFYDWHVHEVFNESPDQVFVPYGSGRIMENYLAWQERNARVKDPRLKIDVGNLLNISILGAKPEQKGSMADKLACEYNPFVILRDQDVTALRALMFTGKDTGVYGVEESRIREAYDILSRHCDCEPSAAAGLALYMQIHDEGNIDPRHKVVVVNTGRGI